MAGPVTDEDPTAAVPDDVASEAQVHSTKTPFLSAAIREMSENDRR